MGVVSLREPLERKEPTEFLLLPCGTCLGCRKSKAREWALRCQLELQSHSLASWATLTYDEEHVPLTLDKSHLQGFIRALRKRLGTHSVRYFASGEYGELTERPHYHAILFGVPQGHTDLQRSWPYGHLQSDPITPANIAYTAGYCSKKVGWKLDLGQRVDLETGEVYDYQPPFTLMSRNPGIGSNARDQYPASWRDKAIYNGLEIPVPRYLHQGWQKTATPTQIQKLQEEKSAKPLRDTSKQSLQAAEAHAESLHKITASKRRKY